MRIPITLACALAATTAFAVDYSGGDYTENFDGMPSSGADEVPPGWGPFEVTGLDGWTYSKVAGSVTASSLFKINDGSSNSGALYDYGTTDSADRALGTLASGSGAYQFGLTLTNTTGSVLTSFSLDFLGEQWRFGGSGSQTPLTFAYAINATDINTGSFISIPELNINSIVTSGAAGALDGNLPANQSSVSFMVDSLLWNPGDTITLRWTDLNDGGNDDGLAVDDLVFSAASSSFTTLQWNTPGGTWDTTSPNWAGGAVYANGDIVQFLDGSQGIVNIDAGGVSPLQVQVSNTTGTYTFQGGALTGGGSLVKTGAGILETSSEIDLGGGISIQGGTLRTLGDDLLSDTASVSVGEGATLDIGAHVDQIGGLVLQGGTVAGDPAALLTIAGGGVNVLGSATTSVIQGVLSSAGSPVNFTIADGAAAVDLRIEGQLFGGSRMIFGGTGTTELLGDNSGFLGGITLSTGALKISNGNALGTASFFFNGGTLISGGDMSGANAISTKVSVGGDVVVDATAGDVEFASFDSFFGNATKTMTILGNVAISGSVTGTSVINKKGTGLLVIAGVDDSSGRTTVQEGTLKFASTATFTNTGFIRVDPGATLDASELTSALVIQRTETAVQELNGGGTVLAPSLGIQINGVLAPGATTEGNFTQTLTVNGGPLTLASEGDFVFQIASGMNFDKLLMDGLLTLDGDLMLSLLDGFVPDSSDEFAIVSADGGIDGQFSNVVDGRIEFSGGSFQIDEVGNGIVLSDFQPVPEPGIVALLAVSGAVLFLVRRRATAVR